MSKIYDLMIVGGGPAGSSAAVYSARKRLNSAIILKEWGGQSIVSDDIQNWIGIAHISGSQLAKNMTEHVKEYSGQYLDVLEDKEIVSVVRVLDDNNQNIFILKDKKDKEYLTKNILITTGSSRKKLNCIGADKYEHKGLTYCATCDGPMFTDLDVIVVGGGNAGFESAAQLLAYCKSVTLLSRGEPRADKITVDKLLNNTKFKLLKDIKIKEVYGDMMLEGLIYIDCDGKEIDIKASGVFVEIGGEPASLWCKDIVAQDDFGHIMIDPWTQRCVDSQGQIIKGVWAAGDVTNILYHQNNIASGDAVRAIEDIYKNIHA